MTFKEIYKEGWLPNDIEWKPVVGMEETHMVSNYGHIKRLHRVNIDSKNRRKIYTEKIFYPKLINNDKCGDNYYTRVSFGMKRDLTHRVVAKAFLINPNNYPEVNHLRGDKKFLSFAGTVKNNYKDGNLEWCTRKQNMEHASRNGLLNRTSKKRNESVRKNQKIATEKAKKVVHMYNSEMNYLATFESVAVAGHLMNIPKQNIGRASRDNKYTAGGFNWRYEKI